ncbi:hypothetical protein [Acanthamoeba polyphaga mimivirus]|nr:hypothetical protein [Acanthamoeba castellanii mamavirus]UMZ08281.1 hypothetical protein [Acanthamoeba polyphaga mimivirus]
MIFCEKCRYSFNITKDVKSVQVGGKVNIALNNLFGKFNKNQQIVESDLSKLKVTDVLYDERFENMTKKDKKKMMSLIKSVNKSFFQEVGGQGELNTNKAYFICKYCKNYRPIEAGTTIYTKNYDTTDNSDIENYSFYIHDHTLQRTKNYICKNKDCKTHQNDNLKEAVLAKNSADQLVYVCTACTTHWINSI